MNKTLKIILGLAAAIVAGGGADAAGYAPDPAVLKDLGIASGLVIVAYLHTVWLPIVLRIEKKLDQVLGLSATAPVEEPETVVEEQPIAAPPPPKRRNTQPHLVAVRPAKEPR